MGLLDDLKKIIGIKSVNVGDLNKAATQQKLRSPRINISRDPLEGIQITDEYRNIIDLLEAGAPIVFVSGAAGTGKSTLINYIRHTYRKNLAVVAPTGVAALHVNGSTIHSLFQLPPRILTDNDIKKVRDRQLYQSMNLLIIDEISMVRADLLDGIDKFMRLNGRYSDEPFGGVQLLLVGDMFQLPPVVKKPAQDMLNKLGYDSPFFFSALSLQNSTITSVELTEVFRQHDPEFTDILHKIRVAEQIDTILPTINSRHNKDKEKRQQLITLTCTNKVADQINAKHLSHLSGEPIEFKGRTSGKFPVKEEKLPAPYNLTLKGGALIMFTKNDENKQWVNGTMGKVKAMKNDAIQVEITEQPGVIFDVKLVTWEYFTYKFDQETGKIKAAVTGEYTQFPLMLAWAITIHKSQGKTLEKVCVDLGHGAFSSGQVYVALSRCRSMQDIHLARPIKKQEIKCDEKIKRFYQTLANTQEKA